MAVKIKGADVLVGDCMIKLLSSSIKIGSKAVIPNVGMEVVAIDGDFVYWEVLLPDDDRVILFKLEVTGDSDNKLTNKGN